VAGSSAVKRSPFTPELRQGVTELFDASWDKTPRCRARDEKLVVRHARNRAAQNNWPCPAGLDEDELDQSGYRPRCDWLPAVGTGAAGQSVPSVRREAIA
jgi:hypothetical protein